MTFINKYLTVPAAAIAAGLVIAGHGLLAVALIVGIVIGLYITPRIR